MLPSSFPTPYQEFIFKSRYARWIDDEQRREDLHETVNRYLDFMTGHLIQKHGYELPVSYRDQLFDHIMSLGIMPSMRAMMTAGTALSRDNTAGFNCAFLTVDQPRSFDEAMFILLCGTGVGFSVERKFTCQLPYVPYDLTPSADIIVVEDSKEGWADSLHRLIMCLYSGRIPQWDTSQVRPAGSRLKTFGGRASGPGPLVELFLFVISTFQGAKGRKLHPIECHDILCKIGDIVVSGGVRRSAMISLSDLDDSAMARSKSFYKVLESIVVGDYRYKITLVSATGEVETHLIQFKHGKDEYDIDQMRHKKVISWYHIYPHRMLSNNSAVFEQKPNAEVFAREWHNLIESGSGERGIFNREAATKQVLKNGRRKADGILFGTNPCAEIILRPFQMCNLSTNIIYAEDTLDDILRKITLSTMLGTFQSTLTHFPYLRDIWRQNTEEERLLGVSLTGVMDHPVLNGSQGEDIRDTWLIIMNEQAVKVNRLLAMDLGIEPSTAITCIKPEGTVSQLTNTSSGMHARHAPYYLRSVRQDNKDPVTAFLKDMNVPHEPCHSKPQTMTVFYFPMKSSDGAVTRHDMTAINQLETWLAYQRYYCEHKPSCTVSVRDEEWMEVGAWVYKNFDEMSGVSFLPMWDHVYAQAPYQDLTEEQYLHWLDKMPHHIDWSLLKMFEKEDGTTNMQALACVSGVCEI